MLAMTDDQAAAYAYILQWAEDPDTDLRFMPLGGAAGTGKSTLLGELKDPLKEKCKGQIHWTAMTGKAARRLHEIAGGFTRTLHSLLYEPPDGSKQTLSFDTLQAPPREGSIVIVDEASMITPTIYQDMQIWARQGVRFLLVGDPYQLPPILSKEEQQHYRDDFTIFSEFEGMVLKTVMRSDNEIVDVATEIRETRKLPIRSRGAYEFRRAHVKTALGDWLEDPNDHVLITWRNALRMKANDVLRRALSRKDSLPEQGEPIVFCRNGQGVMNGQIATAQHVAPGPKLSELITHELSYSVDSVAPPRPIRASLTGKDRPMDGGLPWIEDWGRYRGAIAKQHRRDFPLEHESVSPKEPIPVTWGYTLTAHKAQGSEWRRATVFLSNDDTTSRAFNASTALPDGSKMSFAMRWLYTAIARAKERVTVIVGQE